MTFIPMLRSKVSTHLRRHLKLPEHYRGNLVDQDVKMKEPTWLTDIDPADLLVFVHVPKAAGTSLNAILWQVYGRRYINYHPTLSRRSVVTMIERSADQVLALGAHLPFGFHQTFVRKSWCRKPEKLFAKRRCRYVTVLRDPIERLKSYYRFVTTFPAHRLYKETQGMSPDEFFRHMRDIKNPECANLQCWLVANNRSFEVARDHLVSRYHAVGVVARMDDFVEHLKTTLRWPDVFEARHRNASPDRLHDSDFSDDAIEWIAETNKEDMKLYQFAKEHLASVGERGKRDDTAEESSHV